MKDSAVIAKKDKRRRVNKVIVSAVVITIIVVSMYFLFLNRLAQTPAGKLSPLMDNININNVNTVIHNGATYTTVERNNMTQFAGILRMSGYVSASISNFNASNVSYGDSYPISISSSIIEAANSSDANAIVLTSVSATPIEPNITSSQPTTLTYQYDGVDIPVSTVLTIYTIREPSVSNQGLYPEYQYTSSFSYGNYAGIVVTSGYSTMSPYISQSLAEIVLQNIINYYRGI